MQLHRATDGDDCSGGNPSIGSKTADGVSTQHAAVSQGPSADDVPEGPAADDVPEGPAADDVSEGPTG